MGTAGGDSSGTGRGARPGEVDPAAKAWDRTQSDVGDKAVSVTDLVTDAHSLTAQGWEAGSGLRPLSCWYGAGAGWGRAEWPQRAERTGWAALMRVLRGRGRHHPETRVWGWLP